MPIVALAVVMATSLGLLVLGRRYFTGYVARHGRQPPATWMFRRSDDPQLESVRRAALALLPLDVLAALIYLFRAEG